MRGLAYPVEFDTCARALRRRASHSVGTVRAGLRQVQIEGLASDSHHPGGTGDGLQREETMLERQTRSLCCDHRSRGRRLGLLVLACLVGTAVLTGSAEAAFHAGTTTQGKRVTLTTDANDELTRITFRAWKAPCTRSHLRGSTSIVPPIDRSAPGLFFDRRSGKIHQRRGDYDIKIKVSVRGERISPTRWAGVFRPRATVKHNGNLVARCNAGRIRWRATQQSS
jgi:hypothetical protein